MTEAERVVREAYLQMATKRAIPNVSYKYPTEKNPISMTKAEMAAYERAVKALQREVDWYNTKIEIRDAGRSRDDVYCEHCLKRARVFLVAPAIVSGHSQGDFVCANCHPQVAMAMLGDIVLTESA